MQTGLITQTGATRGRAAAPWVDYSIGLLLFLCAWAWGTVHWNRSVSERLPFFYQNYFEPAAMIACGKGFVIAQPQVPAMSAFLTQQVDRFSCDAIPSNVVLATKGQYEGFGRYLMFAVGFAWRVLGISWHAMGPFFGLLFALTIAALYAVFRLGMGAALATCGAVALSVSKLHLAYLPILRDYAKAPFTLILIFLLGLLVKRQPRWRGVLGISAAYGVVLGIGYGFRTDFLANIPPFFLTVVLFLEGGVFKNMSMKAAAAALCTVTFLVTAWPIVSFVYRSGGCHWHTALLGFSTNFSRPLGVTDTPYQLSRRYSDDFIYVSVTSYAARLHPGLGHIEYCEAEYDAVTGQYLKDLITRFPADIVIRGYASVLRVVELPFTWKDAQPEDGYVAPSGSPLRREERGVGLAIALIAIGVATAIDPRIGLFLFFFALYFGGYPAVQFDARHYFHLEFITWWAAGFLLQCAIRSPWPAVRDRGWDPVTAASLRRAGVLLSVCAAALVWLLWSARAYQQAQARLLLGSYLAAPKEEIPIQKALPGTPVPIARASPATDPETADFLDVELNEWRCGNKPAVTFRYDKATRREFSRTVTLQHGAYIHATTHILMPVYDRFQSIELSDTRPGCLGGLYRVRVPGQLSVLLEAVLPPHWETLPLYEQFGSVGPQQWDIVP